ncbi:hypothetical protein Golax_000123 [Gossypium laxum]|uniref:DUF7804 domain-containing protein n=1 Tax=Gossypium laxum TaxID=34288 RepID=A0A7J9AST9_9ROSI|nr:hypothetical protein [Gossypium laxum]
MAVVCSVGCGCGSVSFQRCESLMLSNPTSSKPRTSKIFATTPPPSSKPAGGGSLQSLQPERSSSKNKRKGIPYEKMDGWMRDSVAEIVKKLPESPLLIHVYSEDATMETTAVEENWVSMKQKWKKGERAMPDGVIFVDQIQGVEEGTWGIVVQSKSEEEDDGCGSGPGSEPVPPACYLLKTTSEVGSGLGLSLESKGACSSYGAVVGDSKGIVRVNCARKLEGIFDALSAEALTIVATLKTTRVLHFHPII